MRHSAQQRRGFTLIELLVVIAIIAILASILFPVFARARAKARQAACQSNLKQLALAVSMYAQDYDGVNPPWGYGPMDASGNNGVAAGFYSWDTIIMPYIKNQGILICGDNPYGRTYRSYAAARYAWTSCALGNPGSGGEPYFLVSQDQMPAPATTLLLFDKGQHLPGQCGDAAGENPIQSHGATGQGLTTDMFHNNGKNFAFCDGHVKWYGQGAGPFVINPGNPCPGAGWPTNPTSYESHGPGHCEFPADWPTS